MSRAGASRSGSGAGALAFVTGNPDKLAEARRIWTAGDAGDRGLSFEAVALELPEIQSLDLLEVLRAKGAEAFRRLRRPLVVEETGLEIEAFNGFPGPLVKWLLAALGPEGMARAALTVAEREGKTGAAVARCMTLYLDGDREIVGEGVERGTLVLPPRGGQGFGWDPVFLPEGESRTYGELPPAEKDRLGHRG
ncbi:MAG TPA: non-canonical purine NTP pyrophosphatase, partial [Thermoanaerobaculia bacterium]|nr:non-canonical purine NTP pyrophosphatase [Thermoanaerobaculia bacterium]